MEYTKWQLHAETSVSQIMLWVIIAKLFGGKVWILAAIFIIGNIFTLIKSAKKLPTNYLS